VSKSKLCQLALLIIVAGCTTPPSKDLVAKAAAPDVQCHTELQTGSLIPTHVCTNQATRNAEQAENKDLRDEVTQDGGWVRPK
jgi:hypothetical protein